LDAISDFDDDISDREDDCLDTGSGHDCELLVGESEDVDDDDDVLGFGAYSFVGRCQRFRETYCLHLQG
jgi:hypothetical protein